MSDASHLVSCILDGKGGLATEGSSTQNDAYTHWVHLDISNPAAKDWLEQKSHCSEATVESLLAVETRPRSFPTKTGMFVILRGVNTNPGEDPEDMVAVRVWISKSRIITASRRKILSVGDIKATLQNGDGPVDSSDFLLWLIDRLADRIGDFVNDIEEKLEDAEDGLSEHGHIGIRGKVSKLRRQMASVRRFLAPQRDALDRLYLQPGNFFSESGLRLLREEADRVVRYLEDLDLARERAVVLQEEIVNLMAQEQNTRMYVLSVVAAIFLPLTFVTGLLGMNVGGLPGVESSVGFWVASVVMIGATGALITIFRWKKWI